MVLIGSTLHTALKVTRFSPILTFICTNQLSLQLSHSFALIICQKQEIEGTLDYVNNDNTPSRKYNLNFSFHCMSLSCFLRAILLIENFT
jgi:hypothetical protein